LNQFDASKRELHNYGTFTQLFVAGEVDHKQEKREFSVELFDEAFRASASGLLPLTLRE
jgi:hypothetical protein